MFHALQVFTIHLYITFYIISILSYFFFQDIVDFLKYLDNWEAVALKNNEPFLPPSTLRGFRVTLQSALEIMQFLTTNFDYTFLMTARLTQDALEVGEPS